MILVTGEALFDLFARTTPDGALDLRAVPGGSPFNLALGLARLGRPVSFLSSLSRDAFGETLAGQLSAGGVDLRLVRRVEAPTTLSVVSTDGAGHPAYAFHEGGADRALAPADLPSDLGGVGAIAAGSYALAVEPIASAIRALVEREGGRRVVSLDPNVRPRVVGDLRAFRERFEGLAGHATILKASEEDLAHLYGGGADPEAVARSWLARGPALVVITRGDRGALALSASARVERPARRVAVVDTVGAGDAFHAGLLAHLDAAGRLERGAIAALGANDLARALDSAIASAALACTRRGADLPRLAEVEALLGQGL